MSLPKTLQWASTIQEKYTEQRRPKFQPMWQHFSTVNVAVSAVGAIIGGKVQQNIELAIKKPKEGSYFEGATKGGLWALK